MFDEVIEIVERSNQRGGRMLSPVDLIEAGTLSLELAAYLVERVESGASFLVGANPGGAGKTAVMGALLTMLPAGGRVYVSKRGGSWSSAAPGDTVVAYEISPASYEAYIWGDLCRRFAELGRKGVRLAANLHADSYEEARAQLTEDNGLSLEQFQSFDLFIPIRMRRNFRGIERRIEQVDLCRGDEVEQLDRNPTLNSRAQEIAGFLKEAGRRGLTRIEELRRSWLDFNA